MQSVPITTCTDVVSSNLDQGYVVQHYVIRFVSDLRQVGGFLRVPVSSSNKTDRHVITEILLKVELNNRTLTFRFTASDYNFGIIKLYGF